RESPLELRAHVGAVAHQVAGAEEQVEEVQRPGALLERLVGVDGDEQLPLEERGEVGVGAPREVLERLEEPAVRGEDLLARGAAAVVPLGAAPGPPELAAP